MKLFRKADPLGSGDYPGAQAAPQRVPPAKTERVPADWLPRNMRKFGAIALDELRRELREFHRAELAALAAEATRARNEWTSAFEQRTAGALDGAKADLAREAAKFHGTLAFAQAAQGRLGELEKRIAEVAEKAVAGFQANPATAERLQSLEGRMTALEAGDGGAGAPEEDGEMPAPAARLPMRRNGGSPPRRRREPAPPAEPDVECCGGGYEDCCGGGGGDPPPAPKAAKRAPGAGGRVRTPAFLEPEAPEESGGGDGAMAESLLDPPAVKEPGGKEGHKARVNALLRGVTSEQYDRINLARFLERLHASAGGVHAEAVDEVFRERGVPYGIREIRTALGGLHMKKQAKGDGEIVYRRNDDA